MSGTGKLADYGALVREYHLTLDLISPQALANWDELLSDALLYLELMEDLAPEATTVLDVGSGVGLPGLPLAISAPDLSVHLVERRRRRSAFLNLARGRLDLPNVTVHHGDAKELSGFEVSVITAQAVGSFASIHALTRHLQAGTVLLLGSKGPEWQAEAGELEERLGQKLLGSSVRPRTSGNGLVVGLLLPGGN